MSEWLMFVREFGFEAFIVLVLLYDKIRSNSTLKKAVENNTLAIKEIKNWMRRAYGNH